MSYTPLEQETTIICNGSSEWRIVVSEHAIPAEKHAADELSRFLEEMSGVRLPIVNDQEQVSSHEIVIGFNKRTEAIDWYPDRDKLGQEGFVIKTFGDRLIIAGGKPRGTLYGVYSFLDDVLGCRWLTSKVSRIPDVSVIKLHPAYFTPELLDEADILLASASDLADDDWIRERVSVVAMQIKYVRMILLNEQVKDMRSSFLDEATTLGITRITELRPLADSLSRLEAGLSVV